jgi:hypothetical protein
VCLIGVASTFLVSVILVSTLFGAETTLQGVTVNVLNRMFVSSTSGLPHLHQTEVPGFMSRSAPCSTDLIANALVLITPRFIIGTR